MYVYLNNNYLSNVVKQFIISAVNFTDEAVFSKSGFVAEAAFRMHIPVLFLWPPYGQRLISTAAERPPKSAPLQIQFLRPPYTAVKYGTNGRRTFFFSNIRNPPYGGRSKCERKVWGRRNLRRNLPIQFLRRSYGRRCKCERSISMKSNILTN